MPQARGHSRRFKTRFRRHAFGWKSQPAITRLQEALSEIKQVARLEPVLAAEGAIALLERISPALEHVDSSSGAIGSAVNRVIAELVPVVSGAPADARTRTAWLDRLFEAHAADQIPYIEQLAEYWGELCDESVARQDTKGLPAFDSVDRKIRPIRREHGRAIELLAQRDKRGIRKVHRQIGILVEQLPDTLQ
jgi:hypothetical protein